VGRSACDRSRSSVPSSELAGPRPRLRAERDNVERADAIVSGHKVKRHLSVEIDKIEWHEFKEATAGRPGPNTRYLKKTKTGWRLSWRMNEDAITYDRASDGMYPLLTNDRTLEPADVLDAHKRQPTIEKHFGHLKGVLEIAPALLKNEGRIEALVRLCSLTRRHLIAHDETVLHAQEPELTPLQRQVLDLLGVPECRYQPNG